MAFPPQYYYSHNYFPYDPPELLTPAILTPAIDGDGLGLAMLGEENLHSYDSGVVPSVSGGTSSFSSVSTYMSLPERLGVSDMALSEYGVGFHYGVAGVHEYGEKCSGLASNSWFNHHESSHNWGIERKSTVQEEATMKIGRYSVEERKDKILKYLKKRNQRNFNKTIKYACRKTLADKRIRVRGRFAKNNKEPDEGDDVVSCNTNNTQKEEAIFYNDDFKIKDDDEDWLHAVMASFMYLPNISG